MAGQYFNIPGPKQDFSMIQCCSALVFRNFPYIMTASSGVALGMLNYLNIILL